MPERNLYRVVIGASLRFTLFVLAADVSSAVEKAVRHAQAHDDIDNGDIVEVVKLNDGHAVIE